SRSATVRPNWTLDRRMVTARKRMSTPLGSQRCKTRRRHGSQALYRNRSTPGLLYRVPAAGKWTGVFEGMEAGGPGEVHRQTAAYRRGGRGGNGQHAAVSRRGGAARRAGSGSEPQPVQGDHAFGEEDRSQ